MSDHTAHSTPERNESGLPNQKPYQAALDPHVTRLILCHTAAALSVLRREMFNPRSSPANRIRAAQILLEDASRTAAIEAEKTQLAQLESLDPQKAALESLTRIELRTLQEMI